MIEKSNKKKRSSLSKQVIAVIVLSVVCLALVGTLIVVNVMSDWRKFPFEGEIYYIARQRDENGKVYYIMTDADRNPLETTSDGYFITKNGTLISIDQSTGKANEYIRPDTEGNEQIGINDRVLMFPHTSKDDTQSIKVYNSKGEFTFYRMRVYEDSDKVSYSCMLRGSEYILLDENGKVFSKGADGLYTLASGNKISIDSLTGAVRTHTYYDFDGQAYNVKKNSEGKYSLYLGDTEITQRISKTGTKTDENGGEYSAELYNYLVTGYGTLISLDAENGTVSLAAIREFDSKGEKYTPYYFLYRAGKYVLCDKDGVVITDTAIDDSDYYSTKNNAYVAFNEANGSYSLRVRKGYYIIANNNGAYQLLYKGAPVSSNGSGYYAVSDSTYVSVDSATGSYATFELDGEEYVKSEEKLLNSKVYTNAKGEFAIENFETTAYDLSLFASLANSAGYTITAAGGKLSSPEKIAGSDKINFAAYGLAECTRKDEAGNEYLYKPSYYIITDLSGNVHKVTIGDKIISGAGYYMRYEGMNADGSFSERQAVYIILDNQSTGYTSSYEIFYYYSITDTLLASIESLVTPMALYPIDINNYFSVENFTLMVYNEQKSMNTLLNDDPEDDENYYDTLLAFSYVDAAERKNTILSNIPYVMSKGCQLYGYEINSYSVDSCLMSLNDLDIIKVLHLGVDDQDLVKYGLDVPRYTLYFEHASVINNEGGKSQIIIIGGLTANDTYYVYSQLYDMIVEVSRASLQFLNWKTTDWLTKDFYAVDLGFSDNIRVESGNYWANFDVQMAQNFTANITTSGSSNFVHSVKTSDDRKTHILTVSAKIYANLTSSAGTTDLVTVDFATLENYYRYKMDNRYLTNLTPSQLNALNEFIDGLYNETVDGTNVQAVVGLAFSDSEGRSINAFVYFMFDSTGEVSVLVAINEETPCFVFSKKTYTAYEKVMFSDSDLTENDKRLAFDFYLSSSVSTNVTSEFEQVIATNSDGNKTVYTKDKIEKTYSDGRVVVDYALGTEYKVFFDVGAEDHIGVSKTWVRFYDMSSKEVQAGGYKEIKDPTYTFESSLVRLIDVNGQVVADGSLGEGKFTVTITSDMVVVKDDKGNETRYLRYSGTQPFSSFYSSLLWGSYEGYCSDISEAEKLAFRESDDSACQMKLTIDTKVGKQYVYRTYQYSERRAYITANGEGDFFVMRSFIDKIVNASKTIFDGTNIDPKDKY